jgi:hypothetical protein
MPRSHGAGNRSTGADVFRSLYVANKDQLLHFRTFRPRALLDEQHKIVAVDHLG